MITHHINDELLMGYAVGGLPEALDLVVATHVSLNDDARARLSAYESLGGSVLEESDSADLADDSFEATMARIMGTPPAETVPEAAKSPMKNAVFPKPLRDYVGGDADVVQWKSIGLGVKQAVISTEDDGPTARLLYIPAGQAMPDHGHHGTRCKQLIPRAFYILQRWIERWIRQCQV